MFRVDRPTQTLLAAEGYKNPVAKPDLLHRSQKGESQKVLAEGQETSIIKLDLLSSFLIFVSL